MIRQVALCLGTLVVPFGVLALAATDVMPIGLAVPLAIVAGFAAATVSTLCGHGKEDAREKALADVGTIR